MICSHCGYRNKDGQRFCIICGTPLPLASTDDSSPVPADESRFMPPPGGTGALADEAQDASQSSNQYQPQFTPPLEQSFNKYQPQFAEQSSRRPSPLFDQLQPGQPPCEQPQDIRFIPNDVVNTQYARGVAAAERTKRKSKTRRAVIIVAAVLAAIIVIMVGVSRAVSARLDPKTTVESYLAALKDGRFADAFAMESLSMGAEQKTLLTNNAIPNPAARISDYTVSAMPGRGDTRLFTVSYTVGGMEETATITLKRDGRRGNVTRWMFETTLLGSVEVSDISGGILTDIRINDITLSSANALTQTATFLGNALTFAAYPGVYTIDMPDAAQSPYVDVTLDPTAVTVTGGSDATPPDIMASASASDALVDEVNSQMSAFFTGCIATANTGTEPGEACDVSGWEVTDGSVLYAGTYTVTTMPTVSSVDFTGMQISDTGVVTGSFTTIDGEYTCTYDDGGQNAPYTASDTVMLGGMLTADDSGVAITWNSI